MEGPGTSDLRKSLLSLLLVKGAQSPERAIAPKEISLETEIEERELEEVLGGLIEDGYVVRVEVAGETRVHLTGIGVITASSAHS